MKKILIPNGSFHDILLIKEAKKMGYYVVTSGTSANQIGHQYADEYIYGDFSDKEVMLKIAKENNITAICSNCNDFGYLSSCYVAEKMGFIGHDSYQAALILHQKNRFKELSKKLNLSSPRGESFTSLQLAKEWLKKVAFPVIVKPSDLGAGQGIMRVDTFSQAVISIEDAFKKSKSKIIVIEPFIEGTNHSFNAFIINKKVVASYSDNEYMKYSKYRVSTSMSPADNIDKVKASLIKETEMIAEYLNLSDGLMHTQYIMDSYGNHHTIEITRRMSGDWYPYPEMESTGIDWINYILKSQCGIDCSDLFRNKIPTYKYTGRHCLNSKRKGIIKDIIIKKELEKFIYDKVMWLGDGFEVNNVEKDYPGIIFFKSNDLKKIKCLLENIDDYIEFIYE